MEQSLPLAKHSHLTESSEHMLSYFQSVLESRKVGFCFWKAPTVKFQMKEHLTRQ